jgi:hypothetical protein
VWWTNKVEAAQIETIQSKTLKTILGCSEKTQNVVVWKDLDIMSLATRQQIQQLKWYGKIQLADENTLLGICRDLNVRFRGRKRAWAPLMEETIRKYRLEGQVENFKQQYKGLDKWAKVVQEKVVESDKESIWGGSKLEIYRLVKEGEDKDRFRDPICQGVMNRAKQVQFRWRSGTCGLNVEMGRWKRTDDDSQNCKLCDKQLIEDVNHVLWVCETYNQTRTNFDNSLKEEVKGNRDWEEWYENFVGLNLSERSAIVLGKNPNSIGNGNLVKLLPKLLDLFSDLVLSIHDVRRENLYRESLYPALKSSAGGANGATLRRTND